MTISEVEVKTGLERTNIRFYEREGFIDPERHPNGYRDYSAEDVCILKRIKLLRRLGISLDTIRKLVSGEENMNDVLFRRIGLAEMQHRELTATEQVCRDIISENAEFSSLDADKYLASYDSILTRPQMSAKVPESDSIPPVKCPYRRFFARMLDLSIMDMIIFTVLSLIFRVNLLHIGELTQWLLGILGWILLIPAEALMLSRFGTTPGKFIMGISLELADGRKPSFGDAASRTWDVFARGMGYTIPIYNLIRLWRCRKEALESGVMEWDRHYILIVKDYSWLRTVCYAVTAAAIMFLSAFTAVLPMLPINRGSELTVEEFVENYNYIESFHGINTGTLNTDGSFTRAPGQPAPSAEPDKGENSPIKLNFTVENGILKGISYERKTFSPWYGLYYDTLGQNVMTVIMMAYAWSDADILEAIGTTDHIDHINSFEDGYLEHRLLNTKVTYYSENLGESTDKNGVMNGRNYLSEFSITRE